MNRWKGATALVALLGLVASFSGCSGGVVSGGCTYAGTRYDDGETFPDKDGCNQCQCAEDGQIACTTRACAPEGCTYDGRRHDVGSTFPASDGCNQCSCEEDGQVACTLIDCAESCEDLEAERAAELEKIQSCTKASECGQTISGSSCGCTRDLVARKDASLGDYLELQKRASEACGIGGGTCDCPAADGFACVNQRCTWNYTTTEPEPNPTCEKQVGGRLCVRGTPTADGEVLAVGDVLSVTVESKGCFSSSCSKVETAECAISATDGFDVSASFCVANTAKPGDACTDDCGNVHADCSFGQGLEAGEHQVRLGSLVVGFQVPTKLPLGGLCAGDPY
jgi:Pacifastin inhibitor (LCMII)